MLEFHGHFGSRTLTSSAIVNRPGAISCLVTENTLAGAIPTQIGHLAQLTGFNLSFNQLTGKHFFAQNDRLVYECTQNLKRPSCCTGNIPTELGRCTAMTVLYVHANQLTGKHFFAQIDRSVYE